MRAGKFVNDERPTPFENAINIQSDGAAADPFAFGGPVLFDELLENGAPALIS